MIRIDEKNQNLNKKLFLYLLICIFILSQELRSILGTRFYEINLLADILIILILLKNITDHNILKISFFVITIIFYFITGAVYEPKIMTLFYAVLVVFIPLLISIIDVEQEELTYIIKLTLKILNVIMVLITVLGLLEKIFGINVNVYISKFMSDRTRYQIIENSMLTSERRLYSFMGHPLYNTELYLIFILLNLIYDRYYLNKETSLWKIVISAIGICLTGSKTGSVLLVITFLFLYKCNTKYKKLLIILGGTILLLQSGMLDTIIYRFLNNDLTTGRNQKWNEIKSINMYSAKLFIGYGRQWATKLNSSIPGATAAFEYPFRMFEFEIGIINELLIYSFIMIIPIMKLIKKKQYYLLSCFFIILIDVNTYNGIAISGDKMMIFCFYIFLLLNTSRFVEQKERWKGNYYNKYIKN